MTKWFTPATWERLWATAVETVASTGLRLIVIFVAYWLTHHALFRIVDAALSRVISAADTTRTAEDRRRRLLTLQTLTHSVIGYVLFFVLALTVLQTLGVNIASILTTAGVAGVAVGLGSQKLVRDVIGGFFIVTEDQFAVGDYVTIGQASGVVEEMGLRTTKLRDDQGRVWMIANGDITVVVNHSRGPLAVTLDIPLPAGADHQRAQEVLNRLGETLAQEQAEMFVEPPSVVGVAAFDAGSVTVRVRMQVPPASARAAEMLVRERARTALIDAGVLPKPAPLPGA